MTSNSTENSSDYPIDDQLLNYEATEESDQYIAEIIAELHNYDTLEDIGFQDYLNLLSE